MSDKEFPKGLFAKAPHPNAPSFVKCGINIKIADLGNYLREKHNAGEEWLNLQVKESKDGKWYAEVDDWKPSSDRSSAPAADDSFDDDIPF